MKNLLITFFLTLCSSLIVYGQEVILIRHAEVFLDHPGWMSAKKAGDYNNKYDTAPIHQFNKDTVLAKIPPHITDTVYVSGLPRSIATGVKLFGDSTTIVSMVMLNEFDMHMIWLPAYLPYKGWTVLSRSLWLLGLERRGTESYGEAKERVKIIANFIEEKAETQKQVILVTHGFLNRNLTKELKKRDWTITQNNGTKNLGATVLKK